jgi:hypothetical protein
MLTPCNLCEGNQVLLCYNLNIVKPKRNDFVDVSFRGVYTGAGHMMRRQCGSLVLQQPPIRALMSLQLNRLILVLQISKPTCRTQRCTQASVPMAMSLVLCSPATPLHKTSDFQSCLSACIRLLYRLSFTFTIFFKPSIIKILLKP